MRWLSGGGAVKKEGGPYGVFEFQSNKEGVGVEHEIPLRKGETERRELHREKLL